ncbi:MAG: phosphoserine transaminase, partial [Rhodospirillales bacterium]
DVVFTWNGTTSGVRVPDGRWIKPDRKGLMIADATSAAFAMELPWDRLDVVTWSWPKALGGEAAHGMLALGPRAVERLESYVPPRPLPKIFRLTSGGKLSAGIFAGETINTPSMLCVEDALDGLRWAESVGGLKGLIARTSANAAALDRWVKRTGWTAYLAQEQRYRSPTSVCVKIIDPWFAALAPQAQHEQVRRLAQLLEDERAALDIAGHRDAPAHLRIWCGATVETADIEALTPWLDWAWGETAGKKAAA